MFDIQARHASLVGVLRQIAAGTVSDPQSWAQRIVAGIDAEIRPSCIWDPFNRDYSSQELVNWVNEHLILDDDVNVVGVIGANQILWEDEGGVA